MDINAGPQGRAAGWPSPAGPLAARRGRSDVGPGLVVVMVVTAAVAGVVLWIAADAFSHLRLAGGGRVGNTALVVLYLGTPTVLATSWASLALRHLATGRRTVAGGALMVGATALLLVGFSLLAPMAGSTPPVMAVALPMLSLGAGIGAAVVLLPTHPHPRALAAAGVAAMVMVVVMLALPAVAFLLALILEPLVLVTTLVAMALSGPTGTSAQRGWLITGVVMIPLALFAGYAAAARLVPASS
jgi:hypothetical protein